VNPPAADTPAYEVVGLTTLKSAGGATFELLVPRLSIARGEKVALVGPSGCGKSTLLDMLSLMAAPDSVDRFRFDCGDQAIDLADAMRGGRVNLLARVRRRSIGYVLQTGGLLPYLTVRQNIGLSCRLLGLTPDRRVAAIAERLEIGAQLDKLPAALSVGERQRAAIARAVVHGPAIAIADEPTAALDPVNAAGVMRLFIDLADEAGCTTVIATHDVRQIAFLGMRPITPELTVTESARRVRAVYLG
jgi:putative ABC transport system ATP-binding protein